MQDLLGFDKMVTPIIIRILYFLGLLAVLAMTATALFQGRILVAIGVLVFGAIIVRVYSELLILLFRIHDNLVSINQQMKARNSSGPL
ncbi:MULTISPECIES: DUF4282 domain-containing protein [Variovorax]|jgi:hypothetical protein|uniref:DUF4282 domain-containing protein n=1 Tax=Variovorax TaxID=34072 RepID=UPI00086BCE18|nr:MULTISPECIES: DUF4282 domain-containing protein [Variovorax]MBN8754866.1 DUF4282 domain-containing protein [Variovorax sp.]ODU11744.1 MAG: hypothetical protein ABS94_33900 [Variovorax sp. SCN 67-85]ODV14893.1 MAG: hypothetical protein ABT25_34050 [Variovorax sp. SCN 67-20]OJZ05389.1 MAG: hypothetical protein BGP22_11575 [Variovorax sp. 67-131]UKI05165.1 DUF4282 domain-containing protein [Variovorax paradoxus]